MDAKELRIGNYIHFNKSHKEVGEITAIKTFLLPPTKVVLLNHRSDIHYKVSDIEPIPLTEEWLVKFGFFRNQDLFYIGEIGLYLDENVWWNDEIINQKMEHVHQLQNLYFALTGEELTYTTN